MSARPHRTAAILSVGDELTLGQTLDTNSRWLSQRLLDAGVIVREHSTVPDDLPAIVRTIQRLAATSADPIDLIILTGGLGPTADDLTRDALAAALHEPLTDDHQAIADLSRWFAGRDMPAANLLQARRPASATCLPNLQGTAPALHATLQATDIFCLPGPPSEMQPMFGHHVLPRLRHAPGHTVATRVLPTYGLGESEIARRLGDLMDRGRESRNLPLVGTTASNGVVSIRIRATGDQLAAARAADAVAIECRGLIGAEWVLADSDRSLAAVVLDLLRDGRQTLALAESCTGGLLGAMLTEVPGSSDAVWGGWITYANAAKAAQLAVPQSVLDTHGAVSAPCARAMAQGALRASGCTHALSVTGIAGPAGGSPNKPVGTVWIALASRDQPPAARRFQLAGDRQNIRVWSAQSALALLRLRMIGREDVTLMRQQENA